MQTFRESDLCDKLLNVCILEMMTTIKGQNKKRLVLLVSTSNTLSLSSVWVFVLFLPILSGIIIITTTTTIIIIIIIT
jgi:hypothetical protein